MSYVEIKDVVKEYKTGEITIKAADGMNFSFEKGEFVVIVGPSGAGKTTVLNILGGMDKLTSGNVIVDGKDISRYSNRELTTYRRHDIGFVFQFYNLVQNLTALENVELAGQICKNPLDAKKVLESVGLKERMKNFPAQLSGGEQQRVSIARAIAKNPKLLLADEPTGALDSRSADELLDLFHEINENGQTILMVTHSIKAASTAKRVLFIKDGEVFHQLYRGNLTSDEMYQKITDTLTVLTTGGEHRE